MSKFIDRSGEAKAALDAALEAALETVGIQAEGNVKKMTPVDTGNLRNSMTHVVDMEPDDEAVYIGTAVEYAPYVEMGTSRTKAQPYLRPGIQDHMSEYRAIFEQYLGQVQI